MANKKPKSKTKKSKSKSRKKSDEKPVKRIGILSRLKNKRVDRLEMRLKKLSLID